MTSISTLAQSSCSLYAGSVFAAISKLPNGETGTRVPKARCDFRQGHQHEVALVEERMRYGQVLVLDDYLPKEEDVEINFSGPFPDLPFAAELLLDSKAGVEQFMGREAGLHLANNIEEIRLVADVKRVGPVNRRASNDGHAVSGQESDSGLKPFLAISQVRPERQKNG